MKVISDRAALLDAVRLVSGVVATRTPRPQLTCVKLTAESEGKAGRLTLAATDTEIALTLRLDAVDVQEPGACLVPADKLSQIIQAEDHEPTLTLDVEGDVCHIRGADAHFQLRGFPPEEFPDTPAFAALKDGPSFAHTAGKLAELVRRTLFAAARENSRYAINGVLLKRDDKKLEMVATDGRRLALARDTLASSDGQTVSSIVPSKALTMLGRLIGEPDEPVSIAVTDSQILFALGLEPGDSPENARALLSSNLVEGTFPPYSDVIPKDQDIRVGFDKDVLASAVRRAALLTNEESRGVRMAFTADERQLVLSSRVPEMGEAKIDVDLASYEGNDIEIGFNPTFITDALKVVDTPEVQIELKAPNKPGVFRVGPDFLYVVMPVNLQ
ncbi:MAG: DNA polymerase III subunit beta [Planctomycetota bacterium]